MSVITTAFSRLLEIDVPIVQAPIGSATTPALVAAVSQAGGLGLFTMSWREPDEIKALIREARGRTSKPFGVNLVLAFPQEERLEACLTQGVNLISFSWGEPPAAWISRIHAAGAHVMQTVATPDEARRAVDLGVDVILAQGWEAGGHVMGEVATMPLIPAVVDAVAPVPVLATGGIADGRGIAAALMLGASGVQLGTRFVATREASAHIVYQEKLVAAGVGDTVYSTLFDEGWPDAPHRTIKNSTVAHWQATGMSPPGERPGEGGVVATMATGEPVLRYSDMPPLPGMQGDVEAMALYAGQSTGLVHEVETVEKIMYQLSDETARVLQRAGGFISPGPVPR